MPMAVDPQQRIRVVLASDEGKPEGEQPTFVFKHLNGRENRQVLELQESMDQASKGEYKGSAATLMDTIYDATRIGLIGWENMPDGEGGEAPFNPDKLEDIVGGGEIHELLRKRILADMLSDEDAKNSESPSPTDGAESATPSQSASAEKEKDVPEAK